MLLRVSRAGADHARIDADQRRPRGEIRAIGEAVSCDDVFRELVVGAILYDELDFIVRREPIEIAPVVLAGFAAAGAFDVDDLHDGGRHARDRPMPAGLEHHGPTLREQPVHQRIHIVLQQRLAAGDLDERAAVPLDLSQNFVDRHLPPLVERVRRVAPRAPQIAGRETDEHARLPRARRFALNRMEDLVHRQHKLLFHLYGQTDVLYEAHLNHVQKRQKFSGYGRRGRA